jgi:hypothetical protein
MAISLLLMSQHFHKDSIYLDFLGDTTYMMSKINTIQQPPIVGNAFSMLGCAPLAEPLVVLATTPSTDQVNAVGVSGLTRFIGCACDTFKRTLYVIQVMMIKVDI